MTLLLSHVARSCAARVRQPRNSHPASLLRTPCTTSSRPNARVSPSGMGLKQMPPVAHVKKMFKLLSHHYPMRLGHVLFTNVGPSVMLCWKVVSPLLQARTKAKMHLIPSTWVEPTQTTSVPLVFVEARWVSATVADLVVIYS